MDLIKPELSREGRKYFLLIGAKYFGPYSHIQIVDFLVESQIESGTLIWHDDLEEWIEIGQCEEFKKYTLYTQDEDLIGESRKVTNLSQANNAERKSINGTKCGSQKLRSYNKIAVLLFTVLALFGIAIIFGAAFLKFIDPTVPLAPYSKKIEDYEKKVQSFSDILKSKISDKIRVEIGRVKNIGGESQMIFVSNIKHDSFLDVTISSKKLSILDHLFKELKFSVPIRNGIGVSPALRDDNNELLPQGFYEVSVTCRECFFGGEKNGVTISFSLIDDRAQFFRNLRNFHKSIKDQAKSEKTEIAEIIKTLNSSSSNLREREMILDQISEFLMQFKDDRSFKRHYIFYDSYLAILKTLEKSLEHKNLNSASITDSYLKIKSSVEDQFLEIFAKNIQSKDNVWTQ